MAIKYTVVTQAMIIDNWRDAKILADFLGCRYEGKKSFCFGCMPTDSVEVGCSGDIITQIRVYSGLNWSAKSGYGSPFINVHV